MGVLRVGDAGRIGETHKEAGVIESYAAAGERDALEGGHGGLRAGKGIAAGDVTRGAVGEVIHLPLTTEFVTMIALDPDAGGDGGGFVL